MKKIFTLILCLLFAFNGSVSVFAAQKTTKSAQKASVSKSTKTTARIAFVIDGTSPANDYFLEKFKKSITQSVSKDYNAVYPKELEYTADWTEAGVKKICDKALASNADIIVALGYLTSKYMSKANKHGKFVVTVDQYGLRDFGDEFFSPVSQTCQKVEQFKRLTGFHKVAIMMNEAYYKTQKDWNGFLGKKFEGKDINFIVVPVNGSVDNALAKIPADVDAAFVMPQFTLTLEQLHDMFDKLTARGIVTFSSLGESDVKQGCLLGSGALDMDRKIAEATSFNIKAVLDGQKTDYEKLYFYEDDILYINIDTAEKIGYEPHIRLLTNAKVITNKKPKMYTLSDVFAKLNAQNLDIKQKEYLIKAARNSVTSAYLRYLPTFSATLGYQQYSGDFAESAKLLYPLRTGVFQMGIDQVIYSPALVTNILIKHRQKDFSYAEKLLTEQNMGIDIALLYIDTLMLENSIKIQEEYVEESRENLAIAKVREKIGYCGREETMRWASQLRINEQNLINMNSEYKNIKITINKLLNQPQNEDFELAPLKADDPAFYTKDFYVLDYVRTPQALEKFTQMLVAESYEVSPELAKLKAAMRMKNVERGMYIQKFFLPDAKLELKYQSLFGRHYTSAMTMPVRDIRTGGLFTMPNSDPTYGYLGIFAQWKPIEGGTKFAEIARVSNEKKQLMALNEEVKISLESKIRTIINEALSCYFSIEKEYKAMYAAKENYTTVKADYLKGKAPISQVVDAQTTYLTTKQQAINAQYEFFKRLVWVQRCLCAVNWSDATPRAKEWIEQVKKDIKRLDDIQL
ncbi:MAG: TolC family protein [Candidatus Gastranaerophilales bacterium]|nr:TolC family protein [Candidatus Gastranaerophilales bacterium]